MSGQLLHCLTLALMAGVVLPASSKNCQDGTPIADRCVAELKRLDRELERLHRLERNRLATTFSPGAPDVEPGYAEETMSAFRAEVAAWRKYRAIKCRSESLRSGMTLQYAGSVATACEVDEARARLKELRKWLKQ